jgi:hypothetical protein
MTAREIFEELGYKQVRNDSCLIKYEKFINGNCIQIIFTLLLKKVIATYGYQTSGSYAHDITLDEFRAIVQQEKELGWLEEEKQKTKEETNFEHFFEYLSTKRMSDFALINGRITQCVDARCSKCKFNDDCIEGKFTWLKQAYEKPKYKLTQFEYDLLSVHKDYKTYNNIANQIHLFKMREKGYFKDVDTNVPIREILDNCEVIKR